VHFAAVSAQQSHDRFEQRRFAHAVQSHQAHDLPGSTRKLTRRKTVLPP
jgi:hypothetical protein